jgi:tetratricopeptide (TPR) repeat protein
MHIDRIEPLHPHTVGEAYLNGEKIRVAFDTGAYTSLLSSRAAARAGIKPDSPGVVDGGMTGGVGRDRVKSYIATFSSFKIGDGEEIKNAKLRFTDMDLEMADMLLGADFFVSHRIFVANKEHRLFLSYNGGPVFNLSKSANSAVTVDPAAGDQVPAAEQAGAQQAGVATSSSTAAITDAGEMARHGSALAARRDFVPALALLSKAIELKADDPEFYYQRANAYWANNQADLALADFDHVIALRQDYLPAYLPRAEIKLSRHDEPGALADLESVDKLAPAQADLRLTLAQIYARMERLPAATEQFGLWIQHHPDDSRMVEALGDRCYYDALQDHDLSTALSDCNSALRRLDKTDKSYPYLLADRGMVRLRQGEIAKAVSDCNDALKNSPKNARALYVRSIAESRQNKKNESVTDLEAAEAISPKIGVRFERYGMVP